MREAEREKKYFLTCTSVGPFIFMGPFTCMGPLRFLVALLYLYRAFHCNVEPFYHREDTPVGGSGVVCAGSNPTGALPRPRPAERLPSPDPRFGPRD